MGELVGARTIHLQSICRRHEASTVYPLAALEKLFNSAHFLPGEKFARQRLFSPKHQTLINVERPGYGRGMRTRACGQPKFLGVPV